MLTPLPNISEAVIVGDAFRIEFFWQQIPALKEEFRLEGLHNTVQSWMDSRIWDRYPHWGRVERETRWAHEALLPVGTMSGFSFSDSVDTPVDQPIGFLDIYRGLPDGQKWQYPDGSPAMDPYTQALSRSFSGKFVARVLGDQYGRRDIYAVLQPQNPYWRDFFVEWANKNIDSGADSLFFDSPDGFFPPARLGG